MSTKQENRRPTDFDVQVGKNLRKARMMSGLTQMQLGDALGVTFQQIQKYENGGTRVSLRAAAHLSTILQVPVQYFCNETEDDQNCLADLEVREIQLLRAYRQNPAPLKAAIRAVCTAGSGAILPAGE